MRQCFPASLAQSEKRFEIRIGWIDSRLRMRPYRRAAGAAPVHIVTKAVSNE